MYVRLAFAVAANLESEILIVDEVLAVGDAEFQKKCLGKMGDVSKGEGRTVLFVSHNMTAVKELCSKGILLNQGLLDYQGGILETIMEYQKSSQKQSSYLHTGPLETALGNEYIRILEFSVKSQTNSFLDIDSGAKVKLRFYNDSENINLDATFELRTYEESVVFHTGALITTNKDSKKGEYTVEFDMPANFLNAGNYYFRLIFGQDQRKALYICDDIVGFEVENVKLGTNIAQMPGIIRPKFNYKIDSNG